MKSPAKNTICLWYDGGAEEAARFYAETFPDSVVGAVYRAPGDFPSGKQGDVLTVEFTVMGIPCLGLNGGPAFRQSEAFSFQVATTDQAETVKLPRLFLKAADQQHFPVELLHLLLGSIPPHGVFGPFAIDHRGRRSFFASGRD